ncbi:disease resistance RPP13-like protein 4 [Magnolia sinica]|uniref:disease resistance RPP13-like protein 4 n=1 Tax=Magnolia sinica TaxID=86752 RepID=UPI002659CFA3|nr:disease resistance RPP13-like protein 4 [Magnolia sinica]XP_058096477.1 disease resistance RPP13-like protein 4 [Magnolia sinica]
MADAVVSVFLEKLVNALAEEHRTVIEFQEQFERMKRQLQLMQSFLKDADRMKRKNQTLHTIMKDLRELVYDAEDILADCQTRLNEETEIAGSCLICFSPTEIPFLSQTGKRLKEINKKIGEIREDMRSYLAPLPVSQTSAEDYRNEVQRWSSPIFDQTQIVGLEEDAMKIKGWLFQANDGLNAIAFQANDGLNAIVCQANVGLNAIGIVGMGGLGKTTTAQKVFNDREVEDHFDRRMWVSVSQTFSEEEIMRSMLKNLGDASLGDSRGELLNKIHQYLLGKRYLIVMDDVWSLENGWWARLCDGLPKGNGSGIIITTRIEEVARKMGVVKGRIHQPSLLSKELSWLLFSKIAFAGSQGECQYPELEDVGKEMVEKCGGLPLAIKAVGGIMLCKSPSFDEWRRIADNFRDELAENDDSVMASLQLSYDELPAHLKSCFLSFSIYPEDCVILKEQLVHWWIGEGFVPTRNGRLTIELGEACFLGLRNRCLVEAADKSYHGKVLTCKIHDLVRDLVIKIAKEEGFCQLNSARSRRLGLRSDINGRLLQTNSKLRALLSTTKTGEANKVSSSAARRFREIQYLRVLDLSKSIFDTHLKDIFSQMGSLKLLTYLSLQNTHPMIEVPHSIGKLSNLQVLDLSYCHNLKTLPTYITTLEKLTILDVSNCGSLEYMPEGLGKLSNLQVLLGFKPSGPSCSDGCRVAELKRLTQLKTLEMRITRGNEIAYDELGVLSHLQQLQFLTIDCFDSHGSDLAGKLDKLSFPQQLHELSIKFFPGELTPAWLNPISHPRLQYLSISSANFSHMNPRFWGTDTSVWKLQGLMLESLSDLEEEWSKVHQAMPSLRIMSVSWCPKLESFPVEDFGFKGGVWRREEERR